MGFLKGETDFKRGESSAIDMCFVGVALKSIVFASFNFGVTFFEVVYLEFELQGLADPPAGGLVFLRIGERDILDPLMGEKRVRGTRGDFFGLKVSSYYYIRSKAQAWIFSAGSQVLCDCVSSTHLTRYSTVPLVILLSSKTYGSYISSSLSSYSIWLVVS